MFSSYIRTQNQSYSVFWRHETRRSNLIFRNICQARHFFPIQRKFIKVIDLFCYIIVLLYNIGKKLGKSLSCFCIGVGGWAADLFRFLILTHPGIGKTKLKCFSNIHNSDTAISSWRRNTSYHSPFFRSKQKIKNRDISPALPPPSPVARTGDFLVFLPPNYPKQIA